MIFCHIGHRQNVRTIISFRGVFQFAAILSLVLRTIHCELITLFSYFFSHLMMIYNENLDNALSLSLSLSLSLKMSLNLHLMEL